MTHSDHEPVRSSDANAADGAVEYTVEELARLAGLPVTTIRLYQHRGLLAPPVRRGRVGYYGEAHRVRLVAIAELQGRGFSLAGIRELFERVERGESLQAVVGVSTGSGDEAPVVMTLAELAGQLPRVAFDAAVMQRVVTLGLVAPLADGHVEVSSPTFLRIGAELAELGMPPDVILDEYEQLAAQTAMIAGRFAGVFGRHLLPGGPPDVRVVDGAGVVDSAGVVDVAGVVEGGIGAVRARYDRLAELAVQVTTLALRRALDAESARFLAAESARLGLTA